jgi:hypothetical protein
MKTKQVKKIVVTAAIIVAVCAVFALLFFGLSRLLHIDKGELVAEYNGNKVYETDVQDIINYQLITRVTDTSTNADLHAIMVDAVRTYVRYKVMEDDLAMMGHTIDEAEFKKEVKEAKEEIVKTHGSVKEWCDLYRVSEDFLEEDLRRYKIVELYNSVVEVDVKVTEKEAKAYYQTHALDKFALPAGYYWTSVLRPVRNISDQTEAAEAKAEMDAYLVKVLNGTMTLEDVDKELNAKYNPDTAYNNAIYDGEDSTAIDGMYTFIDEKDLNDLLNVIDESFKDRDPNADPKSEAYQNYMEYMANTFQARVHYALQNMEDGEIWEETIQSFVGTYIIRLDRAEKQNAFIPYENVAIDIIDYLRNEKLQQKFSEYLDSLETEYNVEYYVG